MSKAAPKHTLQLKLHTSNTQADRGEAGAEAIGVEAPVSK